MTDKYDEALYKWQIAIDTCNNPKTNTLEKWDELQKAVMHILVFYGEEIREALEKAKAYDEAHAQGLLMVWRPLETAPTTKGEDSEEFLLSTESGCVVGFSMGMTYDDDMWVDSREYAEVTPTHWMPLPKELK